MGLKLGVNTRPPTRVPTMLGEDYKYLALFLKRFEMEKYVSRENKCMYVNIMLLRMDRFAEHIHERVCCDVLFLSFSLFFFLGGGGGGFSPVDI